MYLDLKRNVSKEILQMIQPKNILKTYEGIIRLICFYFAVVGQYGGLITLERIADLYDSLGHFLKDLGQLNQVNCYLIKT